MDHNIWVILPPIIVVIAASLTKEVYSSLFLGAITGCLIYMNFDLFSAIDICFRIMSDVISDNASLLIFLVFLGIIVSLITKSGASTSYANAAQKIIKSKRSALLATSALGCLIFIDDYFNCLTVGTVMSPITDKYKVSRAKLAYIIDSTAAPVCILAPISSWGAAVASSLPKESTVDGFMLFLSTIPYNLYAILTLVFLFWIIMFDKDFFNMRKYEDELQKKSETIIQEKVRKVGNGKVIDVVLPVLVLIFVSMLCMLYNGGFFNGVSLIESFRNCDSIASLILGSVITLAFIFVLYIPRKILTFGDFTDCFTEGVNSMSGAILILCLSWTLAGICSTNYLNLGGYIASLLSNVTSLLQWMPVTFFVVSLVLTFATGASWGAFAILIPIIATIFPSEGIMLSLTVSACLAGAVAGDHISPLSDTSILSSAGAQCVHLDHVYTQIPYATVVIIMTIIGYIFGGLFNNGWIGLLTGSISLLIFILFITLKNIKKS